MIRKVAAGGLLAGTVLAALVLAGCSSSPSNESASTTSTTGTTATTRTTSTAATSTTTAVASAPCTKRDILSAAQGATLIGPVASVNNFGCAGSWAFADVTVGTGASADDAVIVLQAAGSTWTVADRVSACSNHLVPSSIYTQACTTS